MNLNRWLRWHMEKRRLVKAMKEAYLNNRALMSTVVPIQFEPSYLEVRSMAGRKVHRTSLLEGGVEILVDLDSFDRILGIEVVDGPVTLDRVVQVLKDCRYMG